MSSIALPSAAAGSSATAQAALFANDDRIYFSKETNTWRFEDEDGKELEYDAAKGKWLPVVSSPPCEPPPNIISLQISF
jgi:HIV Tat-specific factor 1